jgi:outer membrane protein
MKKLLLFLFFISSLYSEQNTFGLGLIHSTNIYLNQNDKTIVLPVVNYTHDKFYIKMLEVGYKYNDFLSFLVEPKLTNLKMNGINERKSTLQAGFKITYPIEKYKLTFKTLFDTLGVYDGYESSLRLSRTFIHAPFIFIPYISIQYQDKNLSDYYFGINTDESFDYYKVDDTINTHLGFVSIYNIDKKYALNLIYNYKKLDKDITNSPIVVKNNTQLTILSLVYKF